MNQCRRYAGDLWRGKIEPGAGHGAVLTRDDDDGFEERSDTTDRTSERGVRGDQVTGIPIRCVGATDRPGCRRIGQFHLGAPEIEAEGFIARPKVGPVDEDSAPVGLDRASSVELGHTGNDGALEARSRSRRVPDLVPHDGPPDKSCADAGRDRAVYLRVGNNNRAVEPSVVNARVALAEVRCHICADWAKVTPRECDDTACGADGCERVDGRVKHRNRVCESRPVEESRVLPVDDDLDKVGANALGHRALEVSVGREKGTARRVVARQVG